MSTRNALSFWAVTGLSVALAHVPGFSWLFAPINLFTTAVHEIGHALVCLLTGGHVSGLTIVSDGSGHGGLTFCAGGLPFFYTQAGYLGAALFGCVLIYLSQFASVARFLLGLLGIALALVAISFMPGTLMVPGHFLQGLGSLLVASLLSLALLWASFKLSSRAANWLVLFLSVQTALNSLTCLGELISISMHWVDYGGFSDATNMADLTGIPAAIWSIFWGAASCLMVVFTLSITYGRSLVPFGKTAATKK
jgi:hypothetical protein